VWVCLSSVEMSRLPVVSSKDSPPTFRFLAPPRHRNLLLLQPPPPWPWFSRLHCHSQHTTRRLGLEKTAAHSSSSRARVSARVFEFESQNYLRLLTYCRWEEQVVIPIICTRHRYDHVIVISFPRGQLLPTSKQINARCFNAVRPS